MYTKEPCVGMPSNVDWKLSWFVLRGVFHRTWLVWLPSYYHLLLGGKSYSKIEIRHRVEAFLVDLVLMHRTPSCIYIYTPFFSCSPVPVSYIVSTSVTNFSPYHPHYSRHGTGRTFNLWVVRYCQHPRQPMLCSDSREYTPTLRTHLAIDKRHTMPHQSTCS